MRSGIGLNVRQYAVQLCSGVIAAVGKDRGYFLRVADIFEGIGIEENKVGNLALFNRSQIAVFSEEPCRVDCCSLERFHGSKAGSDEALQFEMEAETGENVDTGWSICSGEKRNVGLVQLFDDVELVFDEFLSHGEGIRIEVFDDSGGE